MLESRMMVMDQFGATLPSMPDDALGESDEVTQDDAWKICVKDSVIS